MVGKYTSSLGMYYLYGLPYVHFLYFIFHAFFLLSGLFISVLPFCDFVRLSKSNSSIAFMSYICVYFLYMADIFLFRVSLFIS